MSRKHFFFKQKTAYEILRSDWSSDVCSSDLMDSQYLEGTRLLYENEADWDRVGRH